MICNNVNGIGKIFQIVLPNLESFKDNKQFLVMCHNSTLLQSVRVKGN